MVKTSKTSFQILNTFKIPAKNDKQQTKHVFGAFKNIIRDFKKIQTDISDILVVYNNKLDFFQTLFLHDFCSFLIPKL